MRAISAEVSAVNILPSTFSFDGPGVFVGQGVKAGGGQRLFLAEDALYFAAPEALRQRIKSELPRPSKPAQGRQGWNWNWLTAVKSLIAFAKSKSMTC